MRFPKKELKRIVPGLIASLVVIVTVAILLWISMDDDEAPVAVIEPSAESVPAGEPVFFDGRSSSDPDGDDIEYLWTVNGSIYNEESSFYFAFPTPGNYTVVLKVTDEEGRTDTDTVIVEVIEKHRT